MASSPRAFVLRHTRLRPVPGLEEIELYLADDVLDVWGALQIETGDPETALPYWSVAWGGGLAIGFYLRDHAELVAGRRVFDLGSGSGLCAIAAMRAGAQDVEANDIDPFAIAAIALNTRANRCRVDVALRDALEDEPPDVDVILAADCWYNAELAGRVLPWLQRADAAGIEVLIGDPGRDHLPRQALVEVATYDVRTTSDLEDMRLTQGHVYRLGGSC
jgi:predicted nicotinamide N-methyase